MLLIKRRFISRVFAKGSSTIGVNTSLIVIACRKDSYHPFELKQIMSFIFSILTVLLQCQMLLMSGMATSYKINHNKPVDYGIESKDQSTLFYIKRNTDQNLVMYDANLTPNKKFDPKHPVKVYWIRHTEGGIKKDLSFMQRKMAYGLDLKKVSDTYEGRIAAYEKRPIRIMYGTNNKPVAYIVINGKWQLLQQIYLHIADVKAIIPKVTYIQLIGKDVQTGAEVSEKINL